jgi:hypothetical protein
LKVLLHGTSVTTERSMRVCISHFLWCSLIAHTNASLLLQS